MNAAASSAKLRVNIQLTRDRFSLAIDQQLDLSEPLAVYGPSGSGKTTLLRAIAGLEPGARGEVAFGEATWQSANAYTPAWRRRIGFVFQDARLFPHLNVAGNLHLAAQRHNAEVNLHEDEVIEALAIDGLLQRTTDDLSGGEAQRVAIARTLLAQPKLLLMDEPVSALDRRSRRETLEYIATVVRRFALPLIYVTHDAGEVARLAPHTLLLEHGRVGDIGPTPRVFAEMTNHGVDEETVSILTARIAGNEDGLTELAVGNQRLRLADDSNRAKETTQLRVPAKDVVLAKRHVSDTSIRNVLSGTVVSLREFDRAITEVRLDIEGQTLKAHVTKLAVKELGLQTGEVVYAMIKSVALGSALWDERQ